MCWTNPIMVSQLTKNVVDAMPHTRLETLRTPVLLWPLPLVLVWSELHFFYLVVSDNTPLYFSGGVPAVFSSALFPFVTL